MKVMKVSIYLILTPAINMSEKKTGDRIKLVPMTGWFIINIIGKSVKTNGKKMPLNP